MEQSVKWEPVSDLADGFGSLSCSFEGDTLHVVLVGSRSLSLRFSGLVALRYELECPGFDPIPRPLPMLAKAVTFPLIRVQESRWLEQFEAIYPGRAHFVLVTSDKLLQVIAQPHAIVAWLQSTAHA